MRLEIKNIFIYTHTHTDGMILIRICMHACVCECGFFYFCRNVLSILLYKKGIFYGYKQQSFHDLIIVHYILSDFFPIYSILIFIFTIILFNKIY